LGVKLKDENFPKAEFEHISGFELVKWARIPPQSNVTHIAVVRPKVPGLFNFTHATVTYSANEKSTKVQVFISIFRFFFLLIQTNLFQTLFRLAIQLKLVKFTFNVCAITIADLLRTQSIGFCSSSWVHHQLFSHICCGSTAREDTKQLDQAAKKPKNQTKPIQPFIYIKLIWFSFLFLVLSSSFFFPYLKLKHILLSCLWFVLCFKRIIFKKKVISILRTFISIFSFLANFV